MQGFTAASHDAVPLTTQEALSGIFGSISLVAWIVVLVPQLLQNYLSSSADAISLTFLLIWFLGDVANLIGSLWAHLVPTVTALAIYFCFADAILISQCLYYNILNKRRQRSMSTATVETAGTVEDEEEPLLSRRGSAASNLGLPGSHTRRKSSGGSRRTLTGSESSARRRESVLAKIAEEDGSGGRAGSAAWLKNIASILVIFVVGAGGWAIAYKTGIWVPAAAPTHHHGNDGQGNAPHTPLGAEILGYLSAVAYLGARIPQILKNWRERSCEGLSLLFFLLSLLGNLTYGAGVSVWNVLRSIPKIRLRTNNMRS